MTTRIGYRQMGQASAKFNFTLISRWPSLQESPDVAHPCRILINGRHIPKFLGGTFRSRDHLNKQQKCFNFPFRSGKTCSSIFFFKSLKGGRMPARSGRHKSTPKWHEIYFSCPKTRSRQRMRFESKNVLRPERASAQCGHRRMRNQTDVT